MSISPSILAKVKKLLALSTSSNLNEAANARSMADKLIEKHGITEADLSSLEPKDYYGENEKLFVTLGSVIWRQHLAIAISKHYDCQIVQEEISPVGASEDVLSEFHHYVYGDDDQVKDVQFVYHALSKKIDLLCNIKCMGRGSIYLESYCEGVIESVKWNIEMYGIDIPDLNKTLRKPQEQSVSLPTNGIIKSGNNKEDPTNNQRKNINEGSMIKDIGAFFKGIDDGKNISFKEILELESTNEEVIQSSTTE